MIITVASQASWTYLKDVVWIIKRFIEDSSKKVSFMVNSPPHHHKVHNKYWMFKEEFDDRSWRIKMEKPASHATKKNMFWCYETKLTLSFVSHTLGIYYYN